MTYYCLAIQNHQTSTWNWQTTALTSLQAVFQILRDYHALPQGRIRVFTSSSREELHELLSRENNGLPSGSVTAAQFLQERNIAERERAQAVQQGATVATWAKDLWDMHARMRTAQAAQQGATVTTSSSLREDISTTGAPSSIGLSLLEKKRLEIEHGPGGDHDTPYRFTLPISMPQLLAWTRLQVRVQAGELPS